MRLLIDTHIFLWWLKNSRQLSNKARELITHADEVFVSSASIWEISIKIKLNKITVNLDELINAIEENGFIELPITVKHTATVNQLKDLHRDPFDRMLIAQTISEPLRFLTSDKTLKGYSDLIEIA